MRGVRGRRVVGLLAAALAVLVVPPAQAADGTADVQDRVLSWDAAAARLGLAGSLWEPGQTAGLSRTRRISVVAGNLLFADGRVAGGDTFTGTRYGSATRGFRIFEKWADTGWAVDPAVSTSMAKVRTVTVLVGLPGTKIALTADVYANCFRQPANGRPLKVPARFRCTRADVLRTGGVLTMTAQPASQMTAPGDTSIVIQSDGLTFDQLVGIARSVQQVAGSSAEGAGSAQMVGMCRQMVDGHLSPEQAAAFVTPYGYTSRVGVVDGVALPVTADYRPDRFTLAVGAGAVLSCTYG